MALIDCPECKEKISDKAASCPRCGFPMRRHPVDFEFPFMGPLTILAEKFSEGLEEIFGSEKKRPERRQEQREQASKPGEGEKPQDLGKC